MTITAVDGCVEELPRAAAARLRTVSRSSGGFSIENPTI